MSSESLPKLAGLSPILSLMVSSVLYLIESATAQCDLPWSCGNLTNISHPFWLGGKHNTTICSPAAFELACEDDLPILLHSYDSYYYIHDIFYGNKSFWIRSRKYAEEDCPIPHYNVTHGLAEGFKISAANRELLFFYACSAPPPSYSMRIPCDPNQTFAYLGGTYGGNSMNPPASSSKCNMSVSPVLAQGDGGEESSGEFEALFRNGYLVEWEEVWEDVDCRECRASDGNCSFGDPMAPFVCICPDGRHTPRSCSELTQTT